jgi:hypothetical protein
MLKMLLRDKTGRQGRDGGAKSCPSIQGRSAADRDAEMGGLTCDRRRCHTF